MYVANFDLLLKIKAPPVVKYVLNTCLATLN